VACFCRQLTKGEQWEACASLQVAPNGEQTTPPETVFGADKHDGWPAELSVPLGELWVGAIWRNLRKLGQTWAPFGQQQWPDARAERWATTNPIGAEEELRCPSGWGPTGGGSHAPFTHHWLWQACALVAGPNSSAAVLANCCTQSVVPHSPFAICHCVALALCAQWCNIIIAIITSGPSCSSSRLVGRALWAALMSQRRRQSAARTHFCRPLASKFVAPQTPFGALARAQTARCGRSLAFWPIGPLIDIRPSPFRRESLSGALSKSQFRSRSQSQSLSARGPNAPL